MLERAARVNVVAWVDAHLLAILCSHIGRVGGEVNIGHQWLHIAVSFQLGRDVFHVLGLTSTLCSETHQFTTSINDALGLCHRTLRVVGIGSSHRLYSDGIVAANGDIADMSNRGFSSHGLMYLMG